MRIFYSCVYVKREITTHSVFEKYHLELRKTRLERQVRDSGTPMELNAYSDLLAVQFLAVDFIYSRRHSSP